MGHAACTAAAAAAAVMIAVSGCGGGSKTTTTAQAPPLQPDTRYLALGDSIAFGYEEADVARAPDYRHPATMRGYPEQLGAALHLIVANASCPGETSSSLLDPTAQSNGCENSLANQASGYRRSYPLHVRYKGSQLSYALAYLRAHADVRLVSLTVGLNDLFLCAETTPDACSSPAEQRALFLRLSANVRRILSAIRNQAHYSGEIAIVDYYSLNYAVVAIDAQVKLLNGALASAAASFHAAIADGYGAFQAAAQHTGGDVCAAGLVTRLATGKCGLHPSHAGQDLLAQALERAVAR